MKKIKQLLILLVTLLLVFGIIFISGCDVFNYLDYLFKEVAPGIDDIYEPADPLYDPSMRINGQQKESLDIAIEEAEEELKKEKEEIIDKPISDAAEEIGDVEEIREDKTPELPDETITYHAKLTGEWCAHLDGLEFKLKVNYKTLEVEAEGGKDDKSFSASGEVNIKSLQFNVVVGDDPFVNGIAGTISKDFSRIEGGVLSQGIGYDFTAFR